MEESRKRSTQFERQDSSEREKRVEGVPVMHLCVYIELEVCVLVERREGDGLVPALGGEVVDGGLDACACLFALDELLDFFLLSGC